MSIEDYIWGAIVIYSILKRVLKGKEPSAKPVPSKTRAPPARSPRPARPTRVPAASARAPVAATTADLARVTEVGLRSLLDRVASFRAGLDPTVAKALGPLLALEIEATAGRLQVELDRSKNDAMRLAGVARAAREHNAASGRLLATLETIVARRNDPTLLALHRAADRFVAAGALPLERYVTSELEHHAPAPLPLILDDSATSPLYRGFALLPTMVVERPFLWAQLGSALGHWVMRYASDLGQEVGSKLELDGEAGHDEAPDRVGRVLFGAWREPLLADAIAAQWLGPAYLRALSAGLQEPDAPARVVSIAIGQDGVVQEGPPAHVRIHLCAQWLLLLGSPESTIEPILTAWDLAHRNPESLRLTGAYRGSQIPLAPFFATTGFLLDRLHATPLDALGGGRLADLPGFDDHRNLAPQVSQARAALQAQKPAPRHLRATLAAAIDAALATAVSGPAINAWLVRSTATTTAATRRPRATDATAATVPASRVHRGHVTPNHVAHALVLGELLLRPRFRG